MTKDVGFIGSTPHKLSRSANEFALKQFAENNKTLIRNLSKIHSKVDPLQKQLFNINNHTNVKNG